MAEVSSLAEIQERLDAREGDFLEIWARREERSLAALINGNQGWMTLFRFPGDEGVWTFNPDCKSDEDLPFRLENGQLDHYPEYYCYPLDRLMAAFSHFLETGEPDPSLIWSNQH